MIIEHRRWVFYKAYDIYMRQEDGTWRWILSFDTMQQAGAYVRKCADRTFQDKYRIKPRFGIHMIPRRFWKRKD